jgi:hypothetical protein
LSSRLGKFLFPLAPGNGLVIESVVLEAAVQYADEAAAKNS